MEICCLTLMTEAPHISKMFGYNSSLMLMITREVLVDQLNVFVRNKIKLCLKQYARVQLSFVIV
jgi:hypothetical protein